MFKRIISLLCVCILCLIVMFSPPIHYPEENNSRTAVIVVDEPLSPDQDSVDTIAENGTNTTETAPSEKISRHSDPVTTQKEPTELKSKTKDQTENTPFNLVTESHEKSGSDTEKTAESSQTAPNDESSHDASLHRYPTAAPTAGASTTPLPVRSSTETPAPTAVPSLVTSLSDDSAENSTSGHTQTCNSSELSTTSPNTGTSQKDYSSQQSLSAIITDPLQSSSKDDSETAPGLISPDDKLVQTNATFVFENTPIELSNPVYIVNCRYYLPIAEMIGEMGGSFEYFPEKKTFRLSLHQKDIEISGNSFTSGQSTHRLFCGVNSINNVEYISLIDVVRMFDWIADWDVPNETVNIFKKRGTIEKKPQKKGDKTALIRLEDFSAGEYYRHSPEELAKIRIVVDYLESCNIPYYVAWVPRYMDPQKNIDMDPLSNYSTYNICFIYTLDYMVWHSGYIGLHGYTHQHGTEQSLKGNESGSGINDQPGQMRKIIEKAIHTAQKLGIHCTFFEFPHYAATSEQLETAEEYFEYIYEPRPGTYHKTVLEIQKPGRTVKYIPTPLDYINSKYDVDKMLEKIDNLPPDVLASFFFHPVLEYETIELFKESDGYPSYKYDTRSILHRVIEHLQKRGYEFRTIDSL